MAKFVYNNAKNASIGHISFELNCSYYPRIFFEDEVNPCSRLRLADKQTKKLRKLIWIYQQNLLYTQKLQKQAHDKGMKFCS